MKLHKEGHNFLVFVFVLMLMVNLSIYHFFPDTPIYLTISGVISLIFFLFFVSFFRVPNLTIDTDENTILAPADGKIVVIEETEETEYYRDRRIQVSIFMSPFNVHVNRIPFSGKVAYHRYHPGKYLVAWHPKSSTENERNTIVFDNGRFSVLARQIAGKVARKIVAYHHTGDEVTQGKEFGFIKFGSRVDLFLPLNADIKVELNQVSKGGKTIIARIPT